MRNRLSTVVSGLLICLLSPLTSTAQKQRGAIGGTVLTNEGSPIGSARVNAECNDGRPGGTLVRYVETDSNGRFLIDRLTWGEYKIFAQKEDAGYPPMNWSFYSDDVFTTATITPANPTVDVHLRIGSKGGFLIGSVTDASTGAPVGAALKLLRAASPNKWISTSIPATYRVLIPASTDVLLEVSAPGFRTWSPGYAVQLPPGGETRLDISLEPSHDPNIPRSKFLVPVGYVGWLLLEYNVQGAEPVPVEAGLKAFQFPSNGTLYTSSPGPERGADNVYLYYSLDGSTHEIPSGYRSGKGMIWGQYEGTRKGALAQFGFFVGTEEQYEKHKSAPTIAGPISDR